MANYKVNSDRLSIGKKDAVIDAAALADANIQALLDAGHIVPATKTTKQESEEVKDK